MRKRGVLTVIMALTAIFLACAVYAEHGASVSILPIELYETNTDVFDMRVINTNANSLLTFDILEDTSKSSINDISISYSDFTLLASTIPSDWTRSLANDVLAYATNFSAISSGGTLVIAIQATADKVDADITSLWTITTTDLNDETAENTVEITILNDDTPPLLTNPLPYDGMYVKEGTDDQQTNVDAVDNETGILQVNFNYDDCAYLNDTKNVVLDNGDSGTDTYAAIVDLSSYADSTEVCFSFNAENNGGEIGVYSGRLTIDGIAPTVTLISPPDNASMNSQSDFEFIAEDNLAPTMDCELLVDGNEEVSVTVDNNVTTSISVANVSEGQHEWAVRCTDLAGWETTSETRTYILDRTPPSIRLNSPLYLIIKSGTELNFVVTDNFELDGVAYNYSSVETMISKPYITKNESHFTVNTTWWPECLNIVEVRADDAAGNNATDVFAVIIDNTKPVITLISPINESDVNAEFTFNASDEGECSVYDKVLDCTLYINNSANATTQVNTSESVTGVIESLLGPAKYLWRIECEDDAGNTGVSETWNVTVLDTTGPSIVFNNVGVVVRGNDIIINATITDISGVNEDSVYATMQNPENVTIDVTLEREEGTDNYIGSYPTTVISPLGDYIARVFAEDTIGNFASNYAIYELTYAYVVALTLSPNPAETNQEVTASGTVSYDSGESADDEFITLILPDTTIDIAIEAGSFSLPFSAPSVAGDYDITASITDENGFTFSATEILTVNEASSGGGGDSSGGGGGGSSGGDDDGHSAGPCPNCGPCESDDECGGNKICYNGACIKRQCDKDGDCGQGKECNNGRCVGQQEEETVYDTGDAGILYHYCTDGTCDYDENCENCPEDCGACKPGAEATGFFNLSRLSSSLLWILLLIAIILFVLVYLYQNGPPKMPAFKRKDKLNLDDYLNRRF